jgi:hypothetical protein
MPPYYLRLAYMSEFLLALVATLDLWSEVGGAGHLELMPWYTKLVLAVGFALATVAGTAAAVAHERAFNAKTIAFAIVALLLAAGMGLTTYYYHLHENDDADSSEDDTIARIYWIQDAP